MVAAPYGLTCLPQSPACRPDDRMTTRRSLLIALGAGALAAPLRSFAQPRSRRIGYLDLGSRQSLADTGRYATFLQGMRELGRIEGKDFFFEARFADGSSDRL